MHPLRALSLRNWQFALVAICFGLLAKLFVPTGYMVNPTANGFVIQMCSGYGAQAVLEDVGAKPSDHEAPTHGDPKSPVPCAFAGLGGGTLPSADPILLVAALVFIASLGFVPVGRTIVAPFPRRLPPLRAPPASA